MTNDACSTSTTEWIACGYPSKILDQIRRDEELIAKVNANRFAGSGDIADALIDTLSADERDQALRTFLRQAIASAFDYESKRLRKQMKAGGVVRTDFPFLLAEEIAWNVKWDDGGSATSADTLAQLTPKAEAYMSSLLVRWKMPDGRTLGEANAGYLRKIARNERATAEGHLRDAIFYERLAGDLPDDAVIRDHVKPFEAEAARLFAFENAGEDVVSPTAERKAA